jgi:hypothetical protein
MLAASGRDPVAVRDLIAPQPVSGVVVPDQFMGNTFDNQFPAKLVYNDEFLHNMLTHQWTDGGTAAATMLADIPDTATMTDPTDRTQQAVAVRSGETVRVFDQYIANHRDELLNIPGTDNQSLGQLSPDLTRALAAANAPYIDDMMTDTLDNTVGFQPLDDIIHTPRIDNTRNLFAVLDTDSFAAHTLNTAAYGDINAYQQSFANAIKDGTDPQFFDLKSSGALRGVIDMGANVAANDTITDANDAAEQAYENKQLWYDAAKHIPGFDEFVGKIDNIPGAGDAGVFGNLVDPATGQLQPITTDNVESMSNAVDRYLDQFGIDMNTAVDGYREYYEHSIDGK